MAYINHSIALAHLLATTGGVDDVDLLRAAILLDTTQDTGRDDDEAGADPRLHAEGPNVEGHMAYMHVTDIPHSLSEARLSAAIASMVDTRLERVSPWWRLRWA